MRDADLDLLALHMALAKILFLVGHTEVLPPLIRLLGARAAPPAASQSRRLGGEGAPLPPLTRLAHPEPLRRARTLHNTSIRNEHAYFMCMEQLLALPAAVEPTDGGPSAGTPPTHQLWVFGER